MSWFDEQIKQRMQTDNEAFTEAFASIAGVVMGPATTAALLNDRQKTMNAAEEILKFYRVKFTEVPEEITDTNEQLEYLLRPSGIMQRRVTLNGEWYKDAVGAFLGHLKTGEVVAILPHKISGYTFFDYASGKQVKLNRKKALLLEPEAICFYKPLPVKKLGIRDLLLYISQTLSMADYLLVAGASLAVTLVGALFPKLNQIIFSAVISSGNMQAFWSISAMLAAVTVSSLMITATKNIVLERVNTKSSTAVQAAAMMRVLSLPADFFKQHSAGELSNRTQSINGLCTLLSTALLNIGLTSLFSLLYIAQIFTYAPTLVWPALGITLATVLFSVISALVQMRRSKEIMTLEAKESGLIYAFLAGVQKLRLSGAEKRAFAKWAALYRQKASLVFAPPAFIKYNRVISLGIALVGTILLYYCAITARVTVADYFAFNTGYGMVSGAFLSLSGIALMLATVKPMLDMVRPILEASPEVSTDKKVLTRISGSVEFDNVSFRYAESMPLIVDTLSLKIKPGQYVALVGKTGCGKSTLLRLMLGFERPHKGAIYYDGKDLTSIDLKSLRRRIGVVMQNGKLFAGDIFSNITISAPWLTLAEAWEAAELAGIADDIRAMPMGMHTMISEGNGGVSGGQRQRLMIARAIAPKPRVLLFDEATSALDNITQKTVANSLAQLKCTRIVIAHRLSTIQECDRIIVFEQGRIIEDGGYAQLLQNGGYFAELVARQRLNDSEFVGNTTVF